MIISNDHLQLSSPMIISNDHLQRSSPMINISNDRVNAPISKGTTEAKPTSGHTSQVVESHVHGDGVVTTQWNVVHIHFAAIVIRSRTTRVEQHRTARRKTVGLQTAVACTGLTTAMLVIPSVAVTLRCETAPADMKDLTTKAQQMQMFGIQNLYITRKEPPSRRNHTKKGVAVTEQKGVTIAKKSQSRRSRRESPSQRRVSHGAEGSHHHKEESVTKEQKGVTIAKKSQSWSRRESPSHRRVSHEGAEGSHHHKEGSQSRSRSHHHKGVTITKESPSQRRESVTEQKGVTITKESPSQRSHHHKEGSQSRMSRRESPSRSHRHEGTTITKKAVDVTKGVNRCEGAMSRRRSDVMKKEPCHKGIVSRRNVTKEPPSRRRSHRREKVTIFRNEPSSRGKSHDPHWQALAAEQIQGLDKNLNV
ncbi:hypothetical protein ACOMHN_013383 [Nucella lapillus]